MLNYIIYTGPVESDRLVVLQINLKIFGLLLKIYLLREERRGE